MKNILFAAALTLPMAAFAQAPNLLLNSSFQSGDLTSWTLAAGAPNSSPASVTTGGMQAFGNIIPSDNAAGSLSPTAAGNEFVYFVDDATVQVLSQTITLLSAGSYFVGFDYYVPLLGQVNPAPASLSVGFGAGPQSFASTIVANQVPGGVWSHVGGIVTLPAGAYTFSFAFVPTGNGVFSEDFAIDRAYVVAVPEPTTYGMLAAGLIAVGLFARRRNAQV
jgi:PEP-CTERM motif